MPSAESMICSLDEIDAASKALANPMVVETVVVHIFSESAQDGDKCLFVLDDAKSRFACLSFF